MRRTLLPVLILVALGIATSVAVAWGVIYVRAGVRGPLANSVHGLAVIGGTERSVTASWGSGFGGVSAIEARFVLNTPEVDGTRMDPGLIPAPARLYITHPQTGVICAGWPCYCVRGCNYTNMTGANEFHSDGMVLTPLRHRGAQVYMPWHIYWPGLIPDAAVYALAWGLPLYAIWAVRGAWRRSKGRCGACGYDLRASPGEACPECGASRVKAAAT